MRPETHGRLRLPAMGGLVLVVSLVLLYVSSAGSAPSDAVDATTLVVLEPSRPATWQQVQRAGGVLQSRLQLWYPELETPIQWTVESGRLAVAVPPEVAPMWLVSEAARVGAVELVEGGTEFLPLGRRVQSGPSPRPDEGVYETVLGPAHFLAATARLEHGRPAVEFLLTPEGDAHLAAHTTRQRGYYLCIVVDGAVMNCPLVRTPLVERRGLIELTGVATFEQARVLAMLLLSGPLPVTLRPAGSNP